MFPFTKVPCWVPMFDPQPSNERNAKLPVAEEKHVFFSLTFNRIDSQQEFLLQMVCFVSFR